VAHAFAAATTADVIVEGFRPGVVDKLGIGYNNLAYAYDNETGQPVPGALAIPVGMGGGDDPDTNTRTAVRAGIQARLAMDNALFAQNYLTPVVGLGAAWTYRGLTVQAEATVLQLIRVRGEAKDPDEARTNFTVGAHVGYRIIPQLTASAEVHYQHWLWTPSALAENLRGQFTTTLGLRANLPVTHAGILRPGVAFSLPVGGAMETNNYWEVQLDIPFAF